MPKKEEERRHWEVCEAQPSHEDCRLACAMNQKFSSSSGSATLNFLEENG